MQNQTDQQLASDTAENNTSVEGDYIPGKDMLELERERIKSADKRTEIARLAIEANDAADKRMFDYHISKLDREAALRGQQFQVGKNLLYGGGLFIFITLCLLFGMSFYGDSHQSEIASNLLETLMKAMGGIGFYLIAKGAFNKLTKPPEE